MSELPRKFAPPPALGDTPHQNGRLFKVYGQSSKDKLAVKNFEVSSNTFMTVSPSADVDFPIADVESLGSNKLFFLNHFSKEVRFSQIAPGLPPFIADFNYFDL